MSTVVNPRDIEAKIGALGYLPVALFGSIVGLSGLAVGWRMAHAYFGAPQWVGDCIGYVAMLSFLVLVAGYAIKLWSSFDAVKAELNHPIAGGLFATPLISLLLLPILLVDLDLALARALWVTGALGMTIFAWLIVNRWMSVRQQITHATPAWIVPVVGMIDIPLAVPALHFQSMYGVMIFALSIGLFFAVPLFTMIFSRMMFAEPMPEAQQPSLMILVGPFAVGFSAYVTTVGQVDAFAECVVHVDDFHVSSVNGTSLEITRVLSFPHLVVGCELSYCRVVHCRIAICRACSRRVRR